MSIQVDTGGPFAFGDIPDDTDGPGEEDVAQRGWIAPEDRLWRHPSELPRRAAMTFDRTAARDVWRERRGAVVAGTLGAAAVATAAVLILVLANVPTARSTSAVHVDETSLVTAPAVGSGILRAVSAVRPSLVELVPEHPRAPGGHGSGARSNGAAGGSGGLVTGVVLPQGSLVLTAASAVTGVTSADVLTSGGRRMHATVLAADQNSGVAVLSVPSGLPPATFADENVYPGQLAVTACLRNTGSPDAAPRPSVGVSTVREAGRAESSAADGPRLMDAIEAETPGGADPGGVLLDGHGAVMGILDGQKPGTTGSVGLFVPSSLALGVAGELASQRHIDHGWMGVTTDDAPGGGGAAIEGVFAGGPAATAGMERGDVVTTIDGQRVLSYSDLEARLYTIPPGQQVELTFERSGTPQSVSLVLAARAAS